MRSAASDAAWRTGTYGDASGFGDLGDGLTSGWVGFCWGGTPVQPVIMREISISQAVGCKA